MSVTLKIKYGDDLRRISVERTPLFSELLSLMTQLFPSLRDRQFVVKYQDSENDMVTIASDLETKEAVELARQHMNALLRVFVFDSATATATPSAVPEDKGKAKEPAGPTPAANPFAALQGILEGNVGDLSSVFQSLGLGAGPPSANGSPAIDLTAFLPMLQQFFGGQFPPAPAQQQQEQAPAASSSSASSNNNNNNNNNSDAVHHGVVCDGCNASPIVGARYKCTSCPDYDLCSTCEAKGAHDPAHAFIKLAVPRGHGHCGPVHGHPWRRFGFPGHGFNAGSPDGQRGCPYMRNRPQPRANHLARYVQDVTVEDGTSMAPNTKFVKIWKMRNEGSAAWPENTVLAFVGGDQLGAAESVPVPIVKEGEEVDIAVDMTAPATSGRYTGYWRLAGPDGQRFGQRIWVDVFVAQEQEVAPSAPPMDVDTPMQQAPEPAPVPVHEPVVPAPAPAPAPVAAPVPAPVAAPALSGDEEQALAVLKEMGFTGDLLTVLRKNQGQLLATIRDLCA